MTAFNNEIFLFGKDIEENDFSMNQLNNNLHIEKFNPIANAWQII